MIHPEITVTLTPDDIKLYDRAKAIGIPSIIISMYGDRIKRLLAEDREQEREACAKVCEQLWDYPENGMATEEECYGNKCADHIRARGQA